MKTKLQIKKNKYGLAFIIAFLLSPFLLNAQYTAFTTSQTSPLGASINISSSKGGVGPNAPQAVITKGYTDRLLKGNIALVEGARAYAVANIPATNYYKAKAGEAFSITVSGIAVNIQCSYYTSTFDASQSATSFTSSEAFTGGAGVNRNFSTIPTAVGGGVNYNYTISNIKFPHGAAMGYVVLNFYEQREDNTDIFSPCLPNFAQGVFSILLPFVVEGVVDPRPPIVLDGTNTPRIITQPSLPITVLHSPPGDQSYTKMLSTKTICQSTEEAVTTDIANTGYGSVKLGFRGSIGFVATIDIEAFVEFTATGTDGNTTIKTKQTETCVTHQNGFTTPPSGTDIFVCEGLDFNYGIFDNVSLDPVTHLALTKKGLAMVPVDNSKKLSFYSRQNIIDQIELRKLDTLNLGLPLKARIDAKNQLNIWKQIITINDNNVANANIPDPNFGVNILEVGNSIGYDASTSVSTSQTNTITVDHYAEAEVGIQGVVNIGGSGFSAGYNYKTSKSFGQTNSATSSSGNTIDVHIQDNEVDDILQVKVFRDPMYGTPLFKLQPGIPNAKAQSGLASGSQTSCPYEGGYQTDQPKVHHTGANSALTHITKNQPSLNLADAAAFNLNLCNDSDYSRGYNLGIGENSNLGGAIIFAGGFNIGQTPHLFTIPAHSCLSNLNVEVKRNSNSSPTTYPDIEFNIIPACADETVISSSVFATVTFGAALPVELISFKGKATEKGNELEWKIASEKDFSHYEIERSTDSRAFEMIGKVNGVGNTKENLSYTFTDTKAKNESTLNYYRMAMVDLDGSKKMSNIIAIDRKPADLSIQNAFPNPVDNLLMVDFTAAKSAEMQLLVYDFMGKLIYENKIETQSGLNSKEIEVKNWTAGAYFIKISDGQNQVIKKIIKQ